MADDGFAEVGKLVVQRVIETGDDGIRIDLSPVEAATVIGVGLILGGTAYLCKDKIGEWIHGTSEDKKS